MSLVLMGMILYVHYFFFFQFEKSEEKYRNTEKQLFQKKTNLVAMETELKHVNRSLSLLESERDQLRGQVTKLSEEIHSLTGINATLEQRLSVEKNSVC